MVTTIGLRAAGRNDTRGGSSGSVVRVSAGGESAERNQGSAVRVRAPGTLAEGEVVGDTKHEGGRAEAEVGVYKRGGLGSHRITRIIIRIRGMLDTGRWC